MITRGFGGGGIVVDLYRDHRGRHLYLFLALYDKQILNTIL